MATMIYAERCRRRGSAVCNSPGMKRRTMMDDDNCNQLESPAKEYKCVSFHWDRRENLVVLLVSDAIMGEPELGWQTLGGSLRDGESFLDVPFQQFREVAARAGWLTVETYIDHGISGAKGRDKRPAFDRNRTIGVVSLLGPGQAQFIDSLVRGRCDAKELIHCS
jgi:hypothetical protein